MSVGAIIGEAVPVAEGKGVCVGPVVGEVVGSVVGARLTADPPVGLALPSGIEGAEVATGEGVLTASAELPVLFVRVAGGSGGTPHPINKQPSRVKQASVRSIA
jgi:hypothetical protein